MKMNLSAANYFADDLVRFAADRRTEALDAIAAIESKLIFLHRDHVLSDSDLLEQAARFRRLESLHDEGNSAADRLSTVLYVSRAYREAIEELAPAEVSSC